MKPSPIPAPILAAYDAVKNRFLALSRPARVLLLSTSVLSVAIGGYFAYDQTHESYAVLFSQLDQEDAAATVAKLKELKTPYKLDPSGSTILVPETRAPELRLELASAGMPRGGGVGFESFDKMKLGATEFEQHVLYRRSLEGELARSIGSLAAVQSARVHLVTPEKSVFVARAEPASASIVLKLRPGRALGPSEVAGIVHLTAASVSGLTPDHVAVVTTEGEMLKKPRNDAAGAGGGDADDERAALQRTTETQLEERARAMLERVVGVGHVDVRVTAEIESARVERVEDHYDPNHAVLRSEESSVDHNGNGVYDQGVAGVPGAESNVGTGPTAKPATPVTPPTPPAVAAADGGAPNAGAAAAASALAAASATPPAAAGSMSGVTRETHTRNFELDHVSEKRTTGPGALKRIAVAVVLDGVPHVENGKTTVVPRDKADLERMSLLVRSAVGASDLRGDLVTVDSVPFEGALAGAGAPNADDAPVATPLGPLALKAKKYAPFAGAGLFALVVIVGLVSARRGKKKRAKLALEIAKTAIPAALKAAPPEILEGVVDEPEAAPKAPIDLKAAALERATQDPATAALVLKAWLGAIDQSETKTDAKMVRAA